MIAQFVALHQCRRVVARRALGEATTRATQRVLFGQPLAENAVVESQLGEMALGIDAAAHLGGLSGPGGTIAVQGYSSLSNIGVEALTGFFSAFINVRIAAPVTAGIALAATIGAGATAQLGAMRISEEIDALEVMAVPSVPFLVTTRVIAGFVAVIPLYVLGFYAGYSGSQGLALVSTSLSVVMWLVFALPCIAATIRRLHDTDRSGWWLLLAFVPFVSLVLLVFLLLPGTPGDNRFGAPVPQV